MLQNCLPQNIRHVLKDLPKSLDETYERLLKEIGEANQYHAHRLLQCLTVAIRPLRVEELAEILALDFEGAAGGIPELNKDWRWQNQQEAVLSTCSSLVTIVGDDSNRVVQFSHISVKEYLTSDRLTTIQSNISILRISLEPAHTIIVKACLGVLLQLENSAGDDMAKTFSPLTRYAAQHWVDHAQFGNVSASVQDGIRRLFDPIKPYFAAWLDLHDVDNKWDLFAGHDIQLPRRAPLYYASLCGFRDVVVHLITEHSQCVNARLGLNHSPLVAALHNKHFEVATVLRQHGAAVDVAGHHNQTPLHAASAAGLIDVAQWLLDHGAATEEQDDYGWTPLHFAAYEGQLGIVRMLLAHGTDIDAPSIGNRMPLHLALEEDHLEIVQLLLQHGSWGVNSQYGSDSTPLHLAVTLGKIKAVQLLIQHGADINTRDGGHRTPLHLAISTGDAETVRLLVQQGADVNAPNRGHSRPLYMVLSEGILKGSVEIARLLVQHGADVNAKNKNKKTALHLTSLEGSAELVQLLIQHGAHVNTRDRELSTPLHQALTNVSARGH